MSRHDYDMEFPTKGSLDTVYRCRHCGDTVPDGATAIHRQGLRCDGGVSFVSFWEDWGFPMILIVVFLLGIAILAKVIS